MQSSLTGYGSGGAAFTQSVDCTSLTWVQTWWDRSQDGGIRWWWLRERSCTMWG